MQPNENSWADTAAAATVITITKWRNIWKWMHVEMFTIQLDRDGHMKQL